MKHKRRHGFTLLELVVAVAIMLIIGAAATPLLLSHIKDAKAGNLNENLLNIKTAFNSYYTSAEGDLPDLGPNGNYLDEVINAGWLANNPTNARWTFAIRKYTNTDGRNAYYTEFTAKDNGTDSSQAHSITILDGKVDSGDGASTGLVQWTDGTASTPVIGYYKLFADANVDPWHP